MSTKVLLCHLCLVVRSQPRSAHRNAETPHRRVDSELGPAYANPRRLLPLAATDLGNYNEIL